MRENKATESSRTDVDCSNVESYKELIINMSMEEHHLLIKKAKECKCTPEELVAMQISKLIQTDAEG